MKRISITLVPVLLLSFASGAFAADAPGKPDCAEKQKALGEASAAAKAGVKVDRSSCKDLKGKDKSACEKPLTDKAREYTKAAKDKVKDAKKGLDCCKNPKKKGCAA